MHRIFVVCDTEPLLPTFMSSKEIAESPEQEPIIAGDPKRFQKYFAHYNTTMRDILAGANTPKKGGVRAIMTGMLVGLGNFVAQNTTHELGADALNAMDDTERAAYECWLRIEQTLVEDKGCVKAMLLEHQDPRAKLL